MKIVRRIFNYVNLISSIIPLVIFIASNIYILYTAVMSWFVEHQTDGYIWMGTMFFYIILIVPICFVIIIVYVILWLTVLCPSVAELIFAQLKNKISAFIFDILTNIASYILLVWLLLFFIASIFYMLFGVMLIETFGGGTIFIDLCGCLIYGTMYVVIISFITAILHSIILIVDLLISKVKRIEQKV